MFFLFKEVLPERPWNFSDILEDPRRRSFRPLAEAAMSHDEALKSAILNEPKIPSNS